MVVGDGKHAHYIIPWAFRNLPIVQKAAKADKKFHISEALNGIPLPSENHLTGHNLTGGYNDTVGEILVDINRKVGNDFNKAYTELEKFIGYLDNLIKNNPNKNLGEIADLIYYPID